MTGRHFWFLAVFEDLRVVEVPQEAGTTRQPVAQRWSRSGTVPIGPNQTTEDVVKSVVTQCKTAGNVPGTALLISVNLLPNVLIPR